MLLNQKLYFFFQLAGVLYFLTFMALFSRRLQVERDENPNPGEGRNVSSYVTSRRCGSSDVAPARDFGRLTSNPQMEPDLQVKTARNSYLMTFFPKSKRVVSRCAKAEYFNSLEIGVLHFICSLLFMETSERII